MVAFLGVDTAVEVGVAVKQLVVGGLVMCLSARMLNAVQSRLVDGVLGEMSCPPVLSTKLARISSTSSMCA